MRALGWLMLALSVSGCGVAFVGEPGSGGAAPDDGATSGTGGLGHGGDGGAKPVMSSAGGSSTAGAGGEGLGGLGGGGGAPPTWTVVETMTVPADGSTATSATTLELGGTYRLRASGTFTISTTQGLMADAEYYDFSDPPASLNDQGTQVDHGLAIDDAVVDLDRTPKWGAYAPSHVYEIDYGATGDPIVAQFHDEVPGNNEGSLTLEILELK